MRNAARVLGQVVVALTLAGCATRRHALAPPPPPPQNYFSPEQVGMQMRREDEGEWFLTDASSSSSRRRVVVSRGRSTGSTRTTATTEAGGIEIPGDQAEPEIIVIGSDSQAETPTVENGQAEGEAVAPANPDADTEDPVLRRLRENRERALNQ